MGRLFFISLNRNIKHFFSLPEEVVREGQGLDVEWLVLVVPRHSLNLPLSNAYDFSQYFPTELLQNI